ncbi:MAG TPA: hypothetical protein HA319_00575 [Nitrosopumilaceae archaeon]|nr:hypothetical protein [Nitrosopumilaceae archaeon]
MIRNKKSVFIFFLISFSLGISCVIVYHLTGSEELLLATRLIGSAFFLGVYFYTVSLIKKQEKMIKDSNGFLEFPFDPSVLKLLLLLFVAGWTTFSVLDYFGLNPIDWIVVYVMGIIIIPIALGLLPLWIKDNKWRRK